MLCLCLYLLLSSAAIASTHLCTVKYVMISETATPGVGRQKTFWGILTSISFKSTQHYIIIGHRHRKVHFCKTLNKHWSLLMQNQWVIVEKQKNFIDIFTVMSSTQMKPSKDRVIVFSCKDIVSVWPPDFHPDLVFFTQFDHTADTGHLATFIGQRGVIQRHYFLFILEYSTLCTPIHRHMHSEVIEAVHGAGEDARVRTVASSLVG